MQLIISGEHIGNVDKNAKKMVLFRQFLLIRCNPSKANFRLVI